MTHADGVPTTIFHYTTADGLLGIIGARELWVTDIEFLNDAQEVRYTVGALEEALTALATGTDLAATLASTLRTTIERRFPATGEFRGIWESRAYVASFCREGDLLSMWRAYGGGPGFSIEFDTAILLDALSSEPQRYDLTDEEYDLLVHTNFGTQSTMLPVSYGKEQATAVASRVIDEMSVGSDRDPDRLLDRFLVEFAGIKHPAFHEEGEVRLLVFPTGDFAPRPLLRVASGHLTPYHPVAFPHEAIRSITVGPATHQARSRTAIERRLESTARGEWGHLEIRTSDAPLLF